MTNLLLLLLNGQLAAIVVYAIKEWRSASKYRVKNLQAQEDELVYADLMSRLLDRKSVVTRRGHERDGQAEGEDHGEVVGAEGANGSHEGFLS